MTKERWLTWRDVRVGPRRGMTPKLRRLLLVGWLTLSALQVGAWFFAGPPGLFSIALFALMGVSYGGLILLFPSQPALPSKKKPKALMEETS